MKSNWKAVHPDITVLDALRIKELQPQTQKILAVIVEQADSFNCSVEFLAQKTGIKNTNIHIHTTRLANSGILKDCGRDQKNRVIYEVDTELVRQILFPDYIPPSSYTVSYSNPITYQPTWEWGKIGLFDPKSPPSFEVSSPSFEVGDSEWTPKPNLETRSAHLETRSDLKSDSSTPITSDIPKPRNEVSKPRNEDPNLIKLSKKENNNNNVGNSISENSNPKNSPTEEKPKSKRKKSPNKKKSVSKAEISYRS